MDLLTELTILVLAAFVGFEVISKVPNTLHTPLMSQTNAIHGIVMLGGLIVLGYADDGLEYVIGTIAVAFGAINIVGGFMVTTVRTLQVNDNAYMKVYRAMEERGLSLAFHSGPNWGEPIYKSCNRFLSVHALGFTWYNVLHLTNWVVNGMGERFPKLPVIWIESGLAWFPFLMQRLDHEYMLRPSEAPLLKKLPSDYMRDMYYSSQPMERVDMQAMECTFRMINADTQLLYSSDYPHWDFDLPSTIYDLPFLKEKAKRDILGGNAAKLFKIETNGRKLAKVA